MATKIAVLSDTHGLLRPEVLDRITGCDVIIHGGDINKPEIIDRLNEIATVYVVRGNNNDSCRFWGDAFVKVSDLCRGTSNHPMGQPYGNSVCGAGSSDREGNRGRICQTIWLHCHSHGERGALVPH